MSHRERQGKALGIMIALPELGCADEVLE